MQNAVSVASLLLTTEATVTDIKEDRPSMPDMSGMGPSKWAECQE